MTDYENAIEIRELTKKYDGFTLDKVSFDVPKGSIMGFIGQNGAGKSTTINCLLNIIKYDSGTVKLLGQELSENEAGIKERLSAVFDEIPFHDSLRASDINILMKDIYEQWDSGTFFEYLDRFVLPRRKKIGQFSKGMKMKLQIAAALSHNAQLLVMDEATTGLDPVVRNEILDIFQEYLQNEDNSILMSAHIPSDLETIADSVTFIDKGRILLTGYKDDILDSHAMIKVKKKDYALMDREDFVSARVNDYGADIMFSDRALAERKYSGAVIEKTTLEDIMLFYVNREKKEWS